MAKKRSERIYIVPRWAALIFSLLVLLIFAVGFVYPPVRGLTQTLGIALLVAGVVALIQSNDNLRGVEIIGCRSSPAPADGEVALEISLRNTADRERIGLQLRESVRLARAWRIRPRYSVAVPVLAAGETTSVRLTIPAGRRGRYAVPVLWVSSVMPVGLCFAWKAFTPEAEYFVYPKPRGGPVEPDTGAGRESSEGPSGESEDVSGHRPYEAGDPLSRMDWRVFARTGKVVVRTLEEGGGGEVSLRWEDTRSLKGEEARLEQLSAWVAQCVREGRPFRLILGSQRGELGHRVVTACQEALAIFHEGGTE